jgi:ankyrin repeat protein
LSLKGTDKVYDNILDVISDTDVFIPFLSVINSLVITKKLDPTTFRLPFDEFKACLGDEYFELLLHRIIHQLYIKVNNLKIQNVDVLLPYKINKEFQSPMYKNNLFEKLSDKLSGFNADDLKKQYENGKINIFKYLSLCEKHNIDIDFESVILSEMKNYNLDVILKFSIEYNFFHGVKYALESGRTREDIDNILIEAIENENNLKIIKYLIDLGASIKSSENEICISLIENNFGILEYFLNNYTFSKSNLNKMLLKLCGSFSEKLNKIKLLVEKGADINYKYEKYQYPLHNSLIFNSFETVKYLLEHGAIVKKELINLAETRYNTPKEIVDLLKKYYEKQND